MAADKWKTITAGNDWKQSVYSWGNLRISREFQTFKMNWDSNFYRDQMGEMLC